MDCPYCEFELEDHDSFGKRVYQEHYYLYPQSVFKKTGNIYTCPNREGFEDKDQAIKYAEENNIEYESWEEIMCESATFNGCFYGYEDDNLREGYPC